MSPGGDRAGSGPDGPDDIRMPPPRRRRRSWRKDSSLFMSTLAAILVVGGLAGVWIWYEGRSGEGADGAPMDTTSATRRVPTATDADWRDPDEPLELPPLGASDEFLRRVAAGLSGRPQWSRWLATDDLVRRFVTAVAQVAAGSSPAEELEFLEPAAAFRVQNRGGRTVIDPGSYRRYDLPAAVVGSLDVEGTARLYRELLPLFQEAYAELGFQRGTFEEAFARALERLVSVEVPAGPVEVVADEGVYRFRDPALEGLSPPEKHLVRMGPDNARWVQASLRELAAELEISVPGSEGGSG